MLEKMSRTLRSFGEKSGVEFLKPFAFNSRGEFGCHHEN